MIGSSASAMSRPMADTGEQSPAQAGSAAAPPLGVADYANVGGNAYDKYRTGNPIAQRLMNRFLADFDAL
ncbi:MAG: hypothetical protein ABIT09_12610, partial [Croceibacterium sp.]